MQIPISNAVRSEVELEASRSELRLDAGRAGLSSLSKVGKGAVVVFIALGNFTVHLF